MIIEMRTYTIVPGRVAEYLKRYEQEGVEIQKEILGNLVGSFTSATGELNQLVQLWGYSDLLERETRRARLWANPQFIAFAEKIYPLIVKQENVLLQPTNFSPVK